MNKTNIPNKIHLQSQPQQKITHNRGHLFSKKLSNIQQDLQLQSEIRMPCIHKKIKNVKNNSEVQLDSKLKRIINNANINRKNNSKSVQSYSTLLNPHKDSITYLIKSQNLPQIKPIPQHSTHSRNKSALDKILADRNQFAKAYFDQISKTERMRKKKPEEDMLQFQQGIQFQFPEIRVGNWKVRGYLKESHILLKGVNVQKEGHVCIKKYDYKKIYEKIRRDYQSWVEEKFSFQA